MRDLPPELQKKLLLSVGSHRASRPLSPAEVAEAIQLSLRRGSTLQDIADSLHLEDTSVLTKFVRLLRLSPAVRHLVDWGRSEATMGFTGASEVARLDDPDEQMQLCQAGLQHQLGSAEMKQILQLHKRSHKPLADSVAEILRLRPRVQRIHLFLGAVTSPDLRKRLAALSQAERDATLVRAANSAFPRLQKFGCRLGSEKFTLTGDEEVSAVLTQEGILKPTSTKLWRRPSPHEQRLPHRRVPLRDGTPRPPHLLRRIPSRLPRARADPRPS